MILQICRTAIVCGALVVSGSMSLEAQHPVASRSLVFDRVTVVDIQQGKLIPSQRVVIVGNRIQSIGTVQKTRVPAGAHVVDARGKYLIPGLWDMHVHPGREANTVYPTLVAYGITGIRDAGSPVPLDTLNLWRREILAGTRIGPPRQILSGQSITGPWADCTRENRRDSNQTCVKDSADAVHYVDSLKSAGVDMMKPRELRTRQVYVAVAAESRRLGLPFGGHVGPMTELEASDQGATIIDHAWGDAGCAYERHEADLSQVEPEMQQALQEIGAMGPTTDKGLKRGDPALVACWTQAAKRFQTNGTWFVPTLIVAGGLPSEPLALANFPYGLRVLAGTDCPSAGASCWGGALHDELKLLVQHGLTPLEALQTATLNPAMMWHATDSLGTIAPGKLADLVLLDASPLDDIANTRRIRAVVANGRYFDHATLEHWAGRSR